MKTIYYYQTFVGLHDLMSHVQDIDVIIVSSIHFGKDKSDKKNISHNRISRHSNNPDTYIWVNQYPETIF